MCVKLPLRDLNPDPCPLYPTSTYTYGVTTAPRVIKNLLYTLMTLSMTAALLAADQFDIVQHDHYKHKPMPLLSTHPDSSPNNLYNQKKPILRRSLPTFLALWLILDTIEVNNSLVRALFWGVLDLRTSLRGKLQLGHEHTWWSPEVVER